MSNFFTTTVVSQMAHIRGWDSGRVGWEGGGVGGGGGWTAEGGLCLPLEERQQYCVFNK